MKERVCEKGKCTACGLCVSLCPVNAVSIKDDFGTDLYARIDKSKCIKCGICKNKCSQNSNIEGNLSQRCYAVWSNNELIRKMRSSGGFIYELCKEIIRSEGCVFALKSFGMGQYGFGEYDSYDSLIEMPGSVYSFSYIDKSVFNRIEEKIQNNKRVLVVGLPCQIDAFRHKFAKHGKKRIYLVDLICSGCSKSSILKRYLNYYTYYNTVSFRGRHNFKLTAYDDNRVMYQDKYGNDLFCRMFTSSVGFRPACYRCKFASEIRFGDLTVGDFWGLDKKVLSRSDQNRGVNLVMINTESGNELFSIASKNVTSIQRPLQEAINGNARLRVPASDSRMNLIFRILLPVLGVKYSADIALRYKN